MSHMSLFLRFILTGALMALAACGANQNPLEVTIQRCPALAVVGGTGSFVRFMGDEKNAADIAYEASITNLQLKCDQDDDVISDVHFDLAAVRGPALPATGEISLQWFVAVVRDNSIIVAKDIYETRLSFESADQQRVVVTERLRQELPDIERARRYNYEILIGFQLDPEDVRYNLLR
ncbi:hypothetical protein JCM17846_15470 [Iodidimonas nitroreducens]|uniref:Lipoprotein n=1 Tax=Iodidimonas nitroreducens TaxID=1236968 RepID=A0A5A7N8A5_9PROT|nr:hypothetical protein [Iodidimonas nitroreducens]GAK33947.1 hypothetical protein AQ1_01840 [alpha proteobacterium Q-1]GER03865.1 hypothetical protein JCM17846_15470 [Iodidimonas nitroreducens]